MVDNIFEYMLRAVAQGRNLTFFQKAAFEEMAKHWRPHRHEQFAQIWATSERLRKATEAIDQTRRRYEAMAVDIAAEREKVHALSFAYRDKKPA